MDKIRRMLLVEMFTCVLVSLVTVVLFETETLLPGYLGGNANTEFLAVSVMEILTICMIPLSLRLFKFKKVSAELKSKREAGLKKWGTVRMMMVCLPMVVNTLLYYLFDLNVAFGYMGIMCLICLLFIYPSASRCASDMEVD